MDRNTFSGLAQMIGFELFPEGIPIDAQNPGRLALIVFGIIHHHLEQRLLDLRQHQLIDVTRQLSVEVHEVGFYGFFYLVLKIVLLCCFGFAQFSYCLCYISFRESRILS